MIDPRWYAAKTKAGQDAIAVNNLTRQSFEVYYPFMTIERSRHGRIKVEKESLFPGYVLIRFALETTAWKVINSTRGVYKLLSFADDGRPSAMPDGEIEKLQEREKQGKLHVSEIIRFRRGDYVRPKIGPSVDQIGEVLRTRGERIEFLLQLFGRKIKCIAPQHTLDLVARAGSSRPFPSQPIRLTVRQLSPQP